jgi:SAM-dependent methyltransferase
MPTIQENRDLWDGEYDWSESGEEWSRWFGGSAMQWHFMFLPRIQRYVPAPRILEIAPGYGRWTQFLKDLCDELIVVDLSERCIEQCKERFRDERHIAYHVNDGKSLEMIEDGTVDFVFTADSLVHAEPDVLAVYLEEIAKKLRPDGVAFVHHSNLGEYARYFGLVGKIPRGKRLLTRLGIIETETRARSRSMTAGLFAQFAQQAGLHTVSQERTQWGRSRRLIDCFSVVTTADSRWAGETAIASTPASFAKVAALSGEIADLYAPE